MCNQVVDLGTVSVVTMGRLQRALEQFRPAGYLMIVGRVIESASQAVELGNASELTLGKWGNLHEAPSRPNSFPSR